MYLVSTGKTTVLSDFADLETKSIYQHKDAEVTDFQFYTNSELFIEVNKRSGLEVMRLKEVSEKEIEIQRVRKLKIENGYCVACARQSLDEIALGLSNGQVKIYNFRKTEMLHRYVENKLNSVIFLDYNASDDNIAAVQENGLINIYGRKTVKKVDSISMDSIPTLARFHPSKRFQLAIASHKGAVTAYDISSKRKTFHTIDSHNAPCRDLCMSLGAPDTLISVGYDCVVNIFDTRRKRQPMKLNHNHPLSTVAMSDCGTFFCVGSLKGELTTYDMRNTKAHLCVKKIHDCAVNRVAFVPQISKEQKSGILSTANTTLVTEQPTTQPTHSRLSQRDSFCDFFDFQINKGVEKTSSHLTSAGRDSFDWEALGRKTSTKYRTSLGTNLSPANGSGSMPRATYSFGDSFENKLNSVDPHIAVDSKTEFEKAPLRELNRQYSQQISPVGKLQQIVEEQQLPHAAQENAINTSTGSDKENSSIHLELQKQERSTPKPNFSDQHQKSSYLTLDEYQKVIDSFRADFDARLHQLEFDLKLNAERNKWEIFTHSFNLWMKAFDKTEEIGSAVSALMQTDPFIVEFNRLKEENKVLKTQLERLSIEKK